MVFLFFLQCIMFQHSHKTAISPPLTKKRLSPEGWLGKGNCLRQWDRDPHVFVYTDTLRWNSSSCHSLSICKAITGYGETFKMVTAKKAFQNRACVRHQSHMVTNCTFLHAIECWRMQVWECFWVLSQPHGLMCVYGHTGQASTQTARLSQTQIFTLSYT